MNLVIVSGLSGSGKSIALQALEDLGYYCIDNLPIGMLRAFADEISNAPDPDYDYFAVGIDARNLAPNLAQFPELLDQLRAIGLVPHVIYLEANEETLIKRFSETRRKHPLTREDTPLAEAIKHERAILEPIGSCADLMLDTSHTNVHELRELIRDRMGADETEGMSILLESFGFKHGIPVDANFVFDVRCISNPHWVPELRRLTGQDQAVVDYLEDHEDVLRMYAQLRDFLEAWIPCFEAENRSYMTVAIGCTGGYHRSVYFVEKLAGHLRQSRSNISVRHREFS